VHLSVVAAGLAVLVIGGVELIARNVGYSPDIEASVSIALLGILPRVLNGIQEAAFIAHGRTELETSTTFVASVAHVGLSAYLLGHGWAELTRPGFYTRAPNIGGPGSGVGPQLFNTVYLLLLSMLLTVPIGVAAGIWFAEYAGSGRLTAVTDEAMMIASRGTIRTIRTRRVRGSLTPL